MTECPGRFRAGSRWPSCPCPKHRAQQLRALKLWRNGKLPELPVEAAWDRIEGWLADGYTMSAIQSASGIPRSTVECAILGRAAGTQKRLTAGTVARILNTDIENATIGCRKTMGATRRLQALACQGWSATTLSNLTGIPRSTLKHVRVGDHEYWSVVHDRKVREVYPELSMKEPKVDGGSASSKDTAARLGWAPPFAWDDIDDPDEAPKGKRDWRGRREADPNLVDRAAVERRMAGDRSVRLNSAEATVMFRQMMDDGHTYNAIRDITGMTVDKRRGRTRKRAAA